MMKTLFTFIFCLATYFSFSQTKEVVVGNFNKIIVSPGIELILSEGNRPAVEIEFTGIDPHKINATVNNHTLSLFLDDARMVPKQQKVKKDGYKYTTEMYQGASITARVTYTDLKRLEIRGDQEVQCVSDMRSPKLKIVQYGDNEVKLEEVNVIKFKSIMYGENVLEVQDGSSDLQVFKTVGENKIQTEGFESRMIKSRIYGSTQMKVNATEKVAVTSFGESELKNMGRGYSKRKIIVGDTDTRRVSNSTL